MSHFSCRRNARGRRVLALGAVLVAVLVSGCTFRPGDRENPIARSMAWYSYLNGDDIRSYCKGGGPDRYRIVYNGIWDEQVRTYDITVDPDGAGAAVVIQVSGSADMSEISLGDPLAPWRGKIVHRHIGRGQLRAIRDGLRKSGFDTPPPKGTRLYSWSFFWLAAACESGQFKYNGWGYDGRYDTPRFDKVALRKPLMAIDTTGVAFNPPRKDVEPYPPESTEDKRRENYELVITPHGIQGQFTPF